MNAGKRGPQPTLYTTSDGRAHTLSEWSEITGISHWTLRARLRAGYTLDRVFTQPIYPKHKDSRPRKPRCVGARIISFSGQSHTFREWSKITGIHWQTIATRLFNGWTIERALTEPTNLVGNAARRRNAREAEATPRGSERLLEGDKGPAQVSRATFAQYRDLGQQS
jgi:hypothetical protein